MEFLLMSSVVNAPMPGMTLPSGKGDNAGHISAITIAACLIHKVIAAGVELSDHLVVF